MPTLPEGQDLLNIAALGITAATFAARVSIADAGADTLVTVNGADGGTITLVESPITPR